MNKNSGTLIIGGLVGLIIRAVIVYLAFRPVKPSADPGPRKVCRNVRRYQQYLGDSHLSALGSALASPAPNWSTLEEVPSPGATPAPVPIASTSPAPQGTVLIARVQVTQHGQNNAPCNMHVTQKVGLNDPVQVQKVLCALDPGATAVNVEPTSTPH
jgi:hypothetical protein